jgi:hypothetical protein
VTQPNRNAQTLHEIIDQTPGLARLCALARQSQARLQAIRPHLPAGLADALHAGGLDEAGQWTLLVPSAPFASKLRQFVPQLERALQEANLPVTKISIKVAALP